MTALHLPDADATASLGEALAATQPAAAVVYLQGDLGAGKSTLARAWLRALGVRGTIRSPTYTLVERYPLDGRGEALHLDLYRFAGAADELEFLGLDESRPQAGGTVVLWLVEWPERGGSRLPAADLQVKLAIDGAGRRVELVAASPAGGAWLGEIAEKPELQHLLSL